MDFETYWHLIGGDANFANRKPAAETAWNNHPDKPSSVRFRSILGPLSVRYRR